MPKFQPVDFEAIKLLVPVHQVLELVGWRPTWERGAIARGPCPIHHSNNPRSRSLAVTRDGWYCHSCHKRGDVVRLWAELHGLSMLQAALRLCERLRMEVPRIG